MISDQSVSHKLGKLQFKPGSKSRIRYHKHDLHKLLLKQSKKLQFKIIYNKSIKNIKYTDKSDKRCAGPV